MIDLLLCLTEYKGLERDNDSDMFFVRICFLCSELAAFPLELSLFTSTGSIKRGIYVSRLFRYIRLFAAYTHHFFENRKCVNAVVEWGKILRWGLIHPEIEDTFKETHHTHCHLEWVASLFLFPWEDLLLRTYWRLLLSWQQHRWMFELRNYCYLSLCPFSLLWKVFNVSQ